MSARRSAVADEQSTRKVRLLVPVAGLDFSGRAGEIIDIPESIADVWLDGVRAQPADAPWPPTAARPEALVADVAAATATGDSDDPAGADAT